MKPDGHWPFHDWLMPASRGDCHAELARAADYHRGGWGGGSATVEEGAFLFGLVCALRPARCLETGTETGYTAAWIASALQLLGAGHLVTVERNAELAKAAADSLRDAGLGDYVMVAQAESLDVIAGLRYAIDFALLDTSIETRAGEMAALMTHLSDRAVVAVHDTNPAHPLAHGCRLDDAFRGMGLDVLHIPTPRGMTLLRKRGQP